MRSEKYSLRIGGEAPVFFAAVIEYLCAEILEVSGDVCKE